MAAQRRSLAWSELRVGILVITSFVLLALAIFYISGASGFFEPQYSITAFFPSANGMRKGAEVWLEGVTVGNVDSVEVSKQADPNKSVEVKMLKLQGELLAVQLVDMGQVPALDGQPGLQHGGHGLLAHFVFWLFARALIATSLRSSLATLAAMLTRPPGVGTVRPPASATGRPRRR